MQLTKQIISTSDEEVMCEYAIKDQNIVILHGAGASERSRYYPLAKEFLKHEYGVILFDFTGHGESTGHLKNSSLKERQELAYQIITDLLPPDSSFILAGFSMSGETVCNLLPVFSNRIHTILLGCPAIYTKEAASLKFGDDQFKNLIRTSESWKNSSALEHLGKFDGKTFIAIGSEDKIIPKAVVDTLRSTAKHLAYKQYNKVSHQLAVWLGEHTQELEKLVEEMVQADSRVE